MIATNDWGLTKFCLLPNLKNMRKPKGKILFKPLLCVSIFYQFFVRWGFFSVSLNLKINKYKNETKSLFGWWL